MPEIPLVPVTRPNGRTYRPRQVVVQPWENDDAWSEWSGGVYVLGTHDIEATRPVAHRAIKSHHDNTMIATRPERCWVRLGYADGDLCWVHDDVRGRAAVCWRAAYPD
jgi:hypothetical protein